MDERVARLQAHQNNIDRYQGLLKTRLSKTEKQYLEKRLSEERFAIAMLDFTSPGAAPSEPAERDSKGTRSLGANANASVLKTGKLAAMIAPNRLQHSHRAGADE